MTQSIHDLLFLADTILHLRHPVAQVIPLRRHYGDCAVCGGQLLVFQCQLTLETGDLVTQPTLLGLGLKLGLVALLPQFGVGTLQIVVCSE